MRLSQEKIESLRLRILEAQNQWKQLGEEYDRRKNQFTESSQVCLQDLQLQIKELKLQIKRARADFKFSMEEWKLYTNTISKQIT
jgi:hypothetical protein